jgi:endo-1,4-beta-D-glucanase Y
MKKTSYLLLCLFGFNSLLTAQINTPSGATHPFNSNASYAYGIMPGNLPSGGTFGKSQDAANAYNTWKTNYVRACGSQFRVLFDDGNSTVSEGIGYGMLLAAYAADKTLFDGLYAYYKANSNGNGFMNWKIGGCTGASGTNGATDADEDVAMSLIVAACQWPNSASPYNYTTEATNLITAINRCEIDTKSTSLGQISNGDGWIQCNASGNTCRNPSYMAPAYFKAFAAFVPSIASALNNVATSSYNIVTSNANSSTGLVSNWSDQNGSPNSCNGPLEYGYESCRNPWRMATDALWNNDSRAVAICTKIAGHVQGVGATSVGGPVAMSGGTGTYHNATFISTFAAGITGSGATYQNLLNNMYSETVKISDSPPAYFGNTLRCISMFMLTGNFWKPCGASSPAPCTPPAASTTASGSTTFCTGGNVVLTANSGTGFTYQWQNNGTTINGSTGNTYTATTSGSYTVTVTSGGCSTKSAAVVVTVNTPPTATITASGATTFCSGGNITLNANTGSGYTYQWKNNANSIAGSTANTYSANASGSYTAVVTANGCSTTSSPITVTVNATPSATITPSSSPSNCGSAGVILNANTGTGFTYLWKNNNTTISGATANKYTAFANGGYTVAVSSNGCSATSAVTTVSNCPVATGIIEESQNSELTIYPSPVTSSLELELKNANTDHVQVTLTNMLGKKLEMYEENAQNNNLKLNIDMSQYPSGIYFISVKGNSTSFIRKIIKR